MRKISHVQYDIEYDIVWTTKYRYKVLKKRYWGQHLWSVGYFCRSVGDITDKIIKEYIENQSDEYEENFKIVQ